ncbi:hypothetical protein A8M65_24690 [Escherichia coli]|nr:hypothetical protein A8M65_24690 [Escherichia coli]HAH2585498.1 hypothetical protein [Escherichia coli]
MTTITKERIELFIKNPLDNGLTRGEQMELARIALASLEAEPVLYQSCTRPTWNSGVPWTEWKERSRECYEDDLRFTDTPDHAGWIYKCRKLYTTPPAPIALEAIENAIEYIRSIAFHIDEDDYHGKHIAYFMRQALAWLEGHSCSDDRLGKADNQPASGNQAAESNRGNEWTGNPDIDNAIIMLDRIDTAESCDDDRIEAVKAVLRRLAGNYPDIPDGLSTVCAEAYQVVGVMADALGVFGDAAVQKVLDNLSQQKLVHRDVLPFSLPVTPDSWISCSERMPEMGERQCYVLAADFKNNYPPSIPNTQVGVYGDWFNDGKPTWDDGGGEDLYLKEVTHWMPLPEPPQEVNQ